MWKLSLVLLVLFACTEYKYYGDPNEANRLKYNDECFKEGDTIIISGAFEGKNLYCMNPILYCTDSTTRFATIAISINDTFHIPYDSLASSAYEIPLQQYHLNIGDPVHIKIRHYVGGRPKLLNPEVR